MDKKKTIARMEGCFVAVPSFFHEDLTLNLDARRRHTRFMLDGGLREGNACLLTTGAAGEFTTLSVSERLQIAEATLEETQGKIGVIVGAQSANQAETIEVAQGAAKLGADAVQISPPFYYGHSEEDVYEYVRAVGESADIGLVVYPTFWTAANLSIDTIDKLIDDVPNIVNLKWRAADQLHYLLGAKRFSSRVCVTDNQISPVDSYLAGVRSFNIHMCNFWPEWGAQFMQNLADGKFAEVHGEFMRVLVPFYELVWEIGKWTGGEGHIDKVCAELIGFDSSPMRPPTRDIRERYTDKIRGLLEEFEVPHLKDA